MLDIARKNSIMLLDYICSNNITLPYITECECDNEVNLYWKNDVYYIDLGFNEDGTYSYFAKNGKDEYILDETLFDNNGIIELSKMFRNVGLVPPV